MCETVGQLQAAKMDQQIIEVVLEGLLACAQQFFE
jgi:hypothetical protein